jgi:hypothetical protein
LFLYSPICTVKAALKLFKAVKIKINAGRREEGDRFSGLPLWTGWVGREAMNF